MKGDISDLMVTEANHGDVWEKAFQIEGTASTKAGLGAGLSCPESIAVSRAKGIRGDDRRWIKR